MSNFPQSSIDRRSVLRFGGLAVAGAGAAALVPVDHAAALSPPASTTLDEAFAGITVPPRALERWSCARSAVLNVVCIGDSITEGTHGGCDYAHGGSGSWVERLATAMSRAIGPTVGYGFRGLWLGLDANSDHEWSAVGTWTRTLPSQVYDVCPFGDGFRSSGGAGAVLTWTKPAGVTVSGFDLYWFNMAGAGNWQYSVDSGAWIKMGQPLALHDNKLHKFYVPLPVRANVRIRAYNGAAACVAPIGGIGVYSQDPRSSTGVVVHNLGRDENFLGTFVRAGAGDPMAWLDKVVANPAAPISQTSLVIMMFSNDVIFGSPATWQANLLNLVNRVRPYADVLLMSPFEQGGRDPVMQATFRATTESVAATQQCGHLDLYDAWSAAGDTGYAAANADGLMLDGLHPSQLGHNDIAARVWRLLRTFS